MIVKKSVKIPVHYDTTKTKVSILDNLTARITYSIGLISELITKETKIDRPIGVVPTLVPSIELYHIILTMQV